MGHGAECPFAKSSQESQNSAFNHVQLLCVQVLISHGRTFRVFPWKFLFLWKRKFADKEKSLKTYRPFASEILNHSSKTSLDSECGMGDNDLISPSLRHPPHVPKDEWHGKLDSSN